MKKRVISLFLAMALALGLCASVTATPPAPVFAPSSVPEELLTLTETREYTDAGGLHYKVETFEYEYPTQTRASEKKKFVATSYTVSPENHGDILIIKMDADFYYQQGVTNSVRCPRYYSSYDKLNPSAIKSYSETSAKFTPAKTYGQMKTQYRFSFYQGDGGGGGATTSGNASLWIRCSNSGSISIS